jgi:hypothetical protein
VSKRCSSVECCTGCVLVVVMLATLHNGQVTSTVSRAALSGVSAASFLILVCSLAFAASFIAECCTAS